MEIDNAAQELANNFLGEKPETDIDRAVYEVDEVLDEMRYHHDFIDHDIY